MNSATVPILITIIAHGRNSASKWIKSPQDRAYHEAQYTALQRLYRDIVDSPRGYGDFNLLCGVTFKAGHIHSSDVSKYINYEDLPL